MNRSSQGLTLAQAIDGFLKYRVVEGLSPNTLASYEAHLKRFREHVGDGPLEEVGTAAVEDFLFWLRSDYVPQCLHKKHRPL